VTDASGNTQQLRLVREPDAVAAYTRDGHFLLRVGDRDGTPQVAGPRGQ
jgi:hypothetical protein